jgi:hypothetical protein
MNQRLQHDIAFPLGSDEAASLPRLASKPTRNKATVQTKEKLKAMVDRVMRRLQKMPEIVAGFFHAPTCAYAKE